MSMGGSKAPADQTVTNTRITGQAEPYYGQLLADAGAIYDPSLGAPTYEGQRLAQATPDQLRAAEMARGIAGVWYRRARDSHGCYGK